MVLSFCASFLATPSLAVVVPAQLCEGNGSNYKTALRILAKCHVASRIDIFSLILHAHVRIIVAYKIIYKIYYLVIFLRT